jgi:hypothetical protein
MERPTGFAAQVDVDEAVPVGAEPSRVEVTGGGDGQSTLRCELAVVGYNSATRGKAAYFWLSFLLAVVLAIAAAYAVLSFSDDETARGALGTITAVGALLTSGVFGVLGKKASEEADKMWTRVEKYCD